MLNVTSNTANAFIDSGEFCIPVGTRFSAGKSSVLYLCFRLTRERDRIRPPSPKLRQHRTIASASLRRLFAPLLQFEKREIHTVFLRFPNFELGQKSCLRLLAELRSAALILLYSINFRSCVSEKRGIGYSMM